MIETKLFELRDEGTFIPAIASRMRSSLTRDLEDCTRERALLRRAGYSEDSEPLVLLTSANGGRSHYDAYDWGSRTWTPAHLYIADNWDALKSGDLIDVRILLGESSTPCATELIYYG
jgi:hypothetical protein